MHRFFSFYFVFILSILINADVQIRRDSDWPPKEILNLMQPLHDKCIKKVNVKPEAITSFSETRDNRNDNDEMLKCYFYCMLEEDHSIGPKGEILMEKLVESLERSGLKPADSSIILSMGMKCSKLIKTLTNVPNCEKGYKLQKCLRDADPVHFYIM